MVVASSSNTTPKTRVGRSDDANQSKLCNSNNKITRMKKTLIVLSVACCFIACAGGKATKQQTADSTAVKTEEQKQGDDEAGDKTDPISADFYDGDDPCLCFYDSLDVEMPYWMVEVEAGTFTMGASPELENASEEEKPAHKVTLTKNFYIGKTEVTQRMWQAVMGYNPSEFEERDPSENRPVERVLWVDVQKFIKKINAATGKNFRLPTEAEWEFAARGGNKSKHYLYSGSNDVDEVAWYDWGEDNYDDTYRAFENVGTKKPNELGIYDMSGNVAEWCSDKYGDYSSEAQTDPQGPATGEYRVVRSGGGCRITTRMGSYPDNISECIGIGFRLVLTK